jgi:hypothetical protein
MKGRDSENRANPPSGSVLRPDVIQVRRIEKPALEIARVQEFTAPLRVWLIPCYY